MMDMPSPCEICEEIVEFHDLRRCRDCKRMCCRECINEYGDCCVCSSGDPEQKYLP
jgi:hypothetical protein